MPARVAVVQAGSVLFDSDASLSKAERFIAEAAATTGGRVGPAIEVTTAWLEYLA